MRRIPKMPTTAQLARRRKTTKALGYLLFVVGTVFGCYTALQMWPEHAFAIAWVGGGACGMLTNYL